jgi:hypothetical protein
MREPDALSRLLDDGFLRREGDRLRTTARWQAAMARAASALLRSGAPSTDLRLPIAAALVAHYGDLADDDVATMVEAVLPIEERELAPLRQAPA